MMSFDMKKSITFALAGLVGIISVSLLIGNRFDASWAGGDGYLAHQVATAEGVEYERGETVTTSEGEWLEIVFGDASFWMDENTEVKLVDGREDSLEINVVQGRVVVIGSMTIKTREVATLIDGVAAVVHYSWLDELEVANVFGSVDVATPETASILPEGVMLRIDTLSPYEFTDDYFVPEDSSAYEFYTEALGLLPEKESS